ncbi:MAG TPA: GNAT family N-acetyltransferase [Acidimicrobiales bacterium]|nr:GNAT family N-acetyltransferase [Acidimicrobiales bacterium]
MADIEPVDIDLAPPETLRALHELYVVSEREHLPGDRPTPFDEWLADERRELSFVDKHRFGALEDGRAVLWATVELRREQNTHFALGSVYVRPDRRRRGWGTRALRRLVEVALDDGRTSLVVDVREGLGGAEFLSGLGLTPRLTEHHNRLTLAEVDRAMLRQWVDRAPERAAGYSLRFWEDRTPPDLMEHFAAFTEVMNTAPRDELEVDDEAMPPEHLGEREEQRLRAGLHWWTLAAVEDATGDFAGFTQLYFSGWRDEIAFQGDTGVNPAHRDRGLGRWLKAAMLLRLLDQRPAVAEIDTWNAGSNDAMLGINHALGFRVIEVWWAYQGELAVIAKALEERS